MGDTNRLRYFLLRGLPAFVTALLVAVVISPAISVGAQANGLLIAITPTSGPSGTVVTIAGSDAPPSATMNVLWSPWFLGETCGPKGRNAEMASLVSADSAGRFTTTFRAEQKVDNAPAPWKGIIFLAKTLAPEGGELISNYACFTFNPLPSVRYFWETRHYVQHGFLAYWEQFGGLPVFGYPLTEEFQENGLTVQYFERARFEWHPGAVPERHDVLLGLLGNELTASRQTEPPFQPATAGTNCTYVPETHHNLCAGFRAYWNQFGGLPNFGYPISEEFVENGITMQYFERARFEWHPGTWPQRYDVLLGRVGAEVLATRGQ